MCVTVYNFYYFHSFWLIHLSSSTLYAYACRNMFRFVFITLNVETHENHHIYGTLALKCITFSNNIRLDFECVVKPMNMIDLILYLIFFVSIERNNLWWLSIYWNIGYYYYSVWWNRISMGTKKNIQFHISQIMENRKSLIVFVGNILSAAPVFSCIVAKKESVYRLRS